MKTECADGPSSPVSEPTGQIPKSEVAQEYWRKFLEAKERNPLFAKYWATWNVRSDALSRRELIDRSIRSLTDDLEEIKKQLSAEERELL